MSVGHDEGNILKIEKDRIMSCLSRNKSMHLHRERGKKLEEEFGSQFLDYEEVEMRCSD